MDSESNVPDFPISRTGSPCVRVGRGMSAKGKKRQRPRATGITVVIVRPITPNRDVLDTVYNILASSQTAL